MSLIQQSNCIFVKVTAHSRTGYEGQAWGYSYNSTPSLKSALDDVDV